MPHTHGPKRAAKEAAGNFPPAPFLLRESQYVPVNAPPRIPLPEDADPAEERRLAARKRLWDIAPAHHCVLLGASFDCRELRQMFRRTGHEDWDSADEYRLHSSAVHFAVTRNDFSRLAHKMLEDRYRHAVVHFKAVRLPQELIDLWREHAARGDAVSAYWAALSHAACDPDASESLSREMHVLAHQAFAANRALTRRVLAFATRAAAADEARSQGQKQVEAMRREAARLRQEAAGLKNEADAARAAAAQAKAALERWDRGDAATALASRIAAVTVERDAARGDADRAKSELRDALRRIEWFRRARCEDSMAERPAVPDDALEGCMEEAIAPACTDLSRRQVLCVGGKTRLVPQYREAVRAANGEFIHHDGGLEDHVGRLPAMLTAADCIVCLTGDVSHAAYHLVKRYGKRSGKPCVLVKQSGAGALSRALAAIAKSAPAAAADGAAGRL